MSRHRATTRLCLRATHGCDMAPGPATLQAGGHDTALGGTTTRHVRARLGVPGHAGWVSWLCTWCTQPVFGLSTVFESLFGPLFTKFFRKKKI